MNLRLPILYDKCFYVGLNIHDRVKNKNNGERHAVLYEIYYDVFIRGSYVMATMEYLCCMAGIDPKKLSKEENLLLEAVLICDICDELAQVYQIKFPDNLKKNFQEKDGMITHGNVINLIVQDLIKSNDYTITGVAAYSNVPEEVIYDIAIGNNSNPSLEVSRKIIELHKTARAELYQRVMQKVTSTYQTEGQKSNSFSSCDP